MTTKHTPTPWEIRDRSVAIKIGGWDGDASGNEWECGVAIHRGEDRGAFELYEDDGHGNGDYISTHDTFWEAARAALALAGEESGDVQTV